jgi:hypothetical protein
VRGTDLHSSSSPMRLVGGTRRCYSLRLVCLRHVVMATSKETDEHLGCTSH